MSSALLGDDADLLLRGGHIHTFDATDSVATAIAVRDGMIVATDAAAEALPAREIVQLDGRTAIPGLNDAHLHAAWLGARWPHLFFSDTPPDEQPTGRLVTTAGERRSALRRAWALLAELGITSYTEPGIGPGEDDGETGCFGTDMLESYVELHREGAQTSRVTLLRLFGTIDGESSLKDFAAGLPVPPPTTDPRWLAIPGVKIFADGIPPMATAWTSDPYPDGTTGHLLTRGDADPLSAFQQMIALAAGRGLQIAVHATGDRSIEEFLTALERAGETPRRRHPTTSCTATSRRRRRSAARSVSASGSPCSPSSPRTRTPGRPCSSEKPASPPPGRWPRCSPRGADHADQRRADRHAGLAPQPRRLPRPPRRRRSGGRRRDSAPAAAHHDGGRRDPGRCRDLEGNPRTRQGRGHHGARRGSVHPGRPFAALQVERTIVDGRTVFARG